MRPGLHAGQQGLQCLLKAALAGQRTFAIGVFGHALALPVQAIGPAVGGAPVHTHHLNCSVDCHAFSHSMLLVAPARI